MKGTQEIFDYPYRSSAACKQIITKDETADNNGKGKDPVPEKQHDCHADTDPE